MSQSFIEAFSDKNSEFDLAQVADAKNYLGNEFLAWLWYSAEKSQCEYPMGSGQKTVRFWVDDRLLMESSRYKGHTQLLTGGVPSKSREAAVALANGRIVKEMRLGLHVKSVGDFSVLLKGETLEPASLRLPALPEQEENELDSRMALVEVFSQALDILFSEFMKVRVSHSWVESVLPQMRDWIQTRNDSAVTLH
ncbi:MAG: hypothetical protein AB8C84_09320 [Oligoflexales bacterium]